MEFYGGAQHSTYVKQIKIASLRPAELSSRVTQFPPKSDSVGSNVFLCNEQGFFEFKVG